MSRLRLPAFIALVSLLGGGIAFGVVTVTRQVECQPTTKGDLCPFDGVQRFAVVHPGSDGDALLADSTQAGGLRFGPVGALPSQSGHGGQFLTTDGSSSSGVASWAAVPTLPSQGGHANNLLTTNGSSASWESFLQTTASTLSAGIPNVTAQMAINGINGFWLSADGTAASGINNGFPGMEMIYSSGTKAVAASMQTSTPGLLIENDTISPSFTRDSLLLTPSTINRVGVATSSTIGICGASPCTQLNLGDSAGTLPVTIGGVAVSPHGATSGQVLQYNGTAFVPAAGGITGSIANNQVAVGNGTNTIGGSSGLTYSSNVLTTATVQADTIQAASSAGVQIKTIAGNGQLTVDEVTGLQMSYLTTSFRVVGNGIYATLATGGGQNSVSFTDTGGVSVGNGLLALQPQTGIGRRVYTVASTGAVQAFCDAELLHTDGSLTINAGDVVVWSNSNRTAGDGVATAAASANLTTIAGVALESVAADQYILIARNGRVAANAETGLTAGQLLGTSGSHAGRVNASSPGVGALIGRATDNTNQVGEGVNKVLVDLRL